MKIKGGRDVSLLPFLNETTERTVMKKNYSFALMTVFIWATGATLLKFLFNDIPNFEALSISSVFSFLFLLISNIIRGNMHLLKEYFPTNIGKLLVLNFGGLFLYNALYYKGISILTAQEACILNYLWPVMLVIFSCIILKERLSAVKLLSILCAFAGVVILSLGKNASAGTDRALGAVCCLAAAACYALYCVYNKKLDLDQNITMMIGWGTVAVSAGIIGVLTEDWVMITGKGWIGMLWMGLVVNAISYLCWALAINNSKESSRIASMAYLTPFLSVIFSAIFLGESITLNAIIALMVIIGGVLASQL